MVREILLLMSGQSLNTTAGRMGSFKSFAGIAFKISYSLSHLSTEFSCPVTQLAAVLIQVTKYQYLFVKIFRCKFLSLFTCVS